MKAVTRPIPSCRISSKISISHTINPAKYLTRIEYTPETKKAIPIMPRTRGQATERSEKYFLSTVTSNRLVI